MVNESQIERMRRNVEAFQHHADDLRSSLVSLRESRVHRRISGASPRADLSERELTILRLIAEGKDNGEIAAALNFGLGTIKLHVREILGKLGASTRTEAAVRAVRAGLI